MCVYQMVCIYNISNVSWNIHVYVRGLEDETNVNICWHSLLMNINTLNIVINYINIVFILQKNHFNP